MSETNHARNQEPSTQADIVKRLETLNKWQEEQKKLLQERQNIQRRQLGLEQRNMYQMLGLLHPQTAKEATKEEASLASEKPQAPKSNENTSEDDDEDEDTQKTTSGYYTTSGAVEVPLEAPPKRAFLRRGTGLKQRFKIDPEELRLNNLPRYKYGNAHPKLRSQQQQQIKRRSSAPPPVPPKPAPKSKPPTSKTEDEAAQPLDAMEKRFQELLFSSKTACNSTPDAKLLSSAYGSGDSASSAVAMARFVELAPPQVQQKMDDPTSAVAGDAPPTLAISWAKVLDSQQLRPLPVLEMRSKGILRRSAQTETEEENLSIFELLEQKANDGTIDMNSSCIKRFMVNNLQRKRDGDADSEAENIEIPVDKRLKEAVLQPLVNEVLLDDPNDAESESNEENDDDDEEEETEEYFKECEVAKPRSQPVRPARVHVRFSEENDTREYVHEDDEDTVSETSTVEATADESDATMTNMNPLDRTDDLFQQFKEILFSALQSRAAEDSGDNADEPSIPMNPTVAFQLPTTISTASTNAHTAAPALPLINTTLLAEDLQAQSNLIRERLAELEKEIAIFKTNNMELIKAKQMHELERVQFATEQQEAADRVKDEKIQMEIYLHDERMKFEEEKAKLAEQMRRAKANSKERKEITRLKQELDGVQLQLKEKEHSHAAAQARLRTQIRNMERDQKAVYDDIERLNKENKRLQCENVKIGRENNNKMLQEINRNIAKLTPKLSTVTNAADEDFTPRARPPFMSVVKSCRKQNTVAQTQKQTPQNNTTSSTRSSNVRKITKSKIVKNENTSDSEVEEPHVSKYAHASVNDDGDEDDVDDDEDDAATANNCKTSPAVAIASTKSETSLMTNIESSSSNTTTNGMGNTTTEFKREIVNEDGSKDIWYPNGNLKKISGDGMLIRMLYFNKDIKETSINEGTVKYYYAETNTWHTSYLDGLEILEFPNGQTEHRHKSGLVEVHFPNNSIKVTNPADTAVQEEWRFADGTTLTQMRSGDKIIKLPNGQKEIHTKLNKRREYPDGTVKLVYPDGSQETRYSNGRLRLKDKDGKLVMDTETAGY